MGNTKPRGARRPKAERVPAESLILEAMQNGQARCVLIVAGSDATRIVSDVLGHEASASLPGGSYAIVMLGNEEGVEPGHYPVG